MTGVRTAGTRRRAGAFWGQTRCSRHRDRWVCGAAGRFGELRRRSVHYRLSRLRRGRTRGGPLRRWIADRRLTAPVGPVLTAYSGSRLGRAAVIGAGGLGASLWGGPVAGFCTVAYGALAVRALGRRGRARAGARARSQDLDTLGAIAADLRAGVPLALVDDDRAGGAVGETAAWPGGDRPPIRPRGPAAPVTSVTSGRAPSAQAVTPHRPARWWKPDPVFAATVHDRPIAWLVRALREVADQTGAPLADLLDRVAADIRAVDRISAFAAAQSAGARATAWLLAALPVAGLGLGYTIGADPLWILLHTPLGAGCAVSSVALQWAGLEWADRLARPAQAVGA